MITKFPYAEQNDRFVRYCPPGKGTALQQTKYKNLQTNGYIMVKKLAKTR